MMGLRKWIAAVFLMLFSLLFQTTYAYPQLQGSATPFPGGPVTDVFWADRGGRFHEGIDIGMDNSYIYAPFKGTATLYFDDNPRGFGWYIEFDIDPSVDPDGGVLIFGDLSADSGYNGLLEENVQTTVNPGDRIGLLAGNGAGYSTGPHMHFEYWPTGYKNYPPADPGPLLVELGVYLGGDFSPAGGAPSPEGGGSHWNVKALMELGSWFNSLIEQFMEYSNNAYKHLRPYAMSLVMVLCIIDLTIPILMSGFAVGLAALLGKVLRYTGIMAVVWLWPEFIDKILLSFVKTSVSSVTGDLSTVTSNMSQPQLILQSAMHFIAPGLNKIAGFSMFDFFENLGTVLSLYFCALIVIIVFAWYSFEIAMAMIEFYLSAGLCTISVPFGAWKFTKFVPEGNVGHLVSSAVKLLFMSFCLFMCVSAIQQMKVTDIFTQNLDSSLVNGTAPKPEDVYDSTYMNYARQMARENGIPEDLFLALISAESSWQNVGPNEFGATGLGQVTPGTAESVGMGGADLMDPETNLMAAAKNLKRLYDMFGNWQYALVAYNGGPASFDPADGIPEWGQKYIDLVNSRLNGSYIDSNAITAEQMLKFFYMCMALCFLACAGVLVPKHIMKVMSGPIQLPGK